MPRGFPAVPSCLPKLLIVVLSSAAAPTGMLSAAAGATLDAGPNSVGVGAAVSVAWSGIPSPSSTDWIGLFLPGATDTAYISWIYVSCSSTPGAPQAAGSCPFVIPSTVPLGTYELRLLANNGFSRLATSSPVVVVSASGSGALSDPNYAEGFGKNATGGAGCAICTVTSSAAKGPGTFDACFTMNIGGNAGIQNATIQFAVSFFTTSQRHTLGSNVTIDGCANGQNGVIYNQGGTPETAGTKNGLVTGDTADNIIIRCINFRSTGAPNSEVVGDPNYDPNAASKDNFIWLLPDNGGTVSNVLIDRCTFFQATNKAFDITGSGSSGTTRNVTFQRNLVIDGALNTLIKYADGSELIKHSISLHHNVFAHGGERQIAQVRDTIGQANGPVDIVNNVAYLATGYFQSNYPDGTTVDPYTLRFWNTDAAAEGSGTGAAGPVDPSNGDSTSGNVIANVVANAFLGDRALLEVRTDTGASEAGIYIGADNLWSAAGASPDSNHYQGSSDVSAPGTIGLPWHTPNVIPAQYQVTTLPVGQLAQLLPNVGAPNRTSLDQQRLDEVAAVLSGSTQASQ